MAWPSSRRPTSPSTRRADGPLHCRRCGLRAAALLHLRLHRTQRLSGADRGGGTRPCCRPEPGRAEGQRVAARARAPLPRSGLRSWSARSRSFRRPWRAARSARCPAWPAPSPMSFAPDWICPMKPPRHAWSALRSMMEAQPFIAAAKHVLARRGVPIRPDMRRPMRPLTAEEQSALDAVFKRPRRPSPASRSRRRPPPPPSGRRWRSRSPGAAARWPRRSSRSGSAARRLPAARSLRR